MNTPYIRLEGSDGIDEDRRILGNYQRLKKENVLQWLQQSKEDEVLWVLKRLFESSPQLLETALEKVQKSEGAQGGSGEQQTQLVPRRTAGAPVGGRRLSLSEHTELVAMSRFVMGHRRKTQPPSRLQTATLNELPIIQFSSPIYYAEEGSDDFMMLDVMRFGNLEGTSEVFYETEDGSALKGRQYFATSGQLIFAPGSALLQIKIKMVDNDLWDTTTEFRCHLKSEGLKGAVLGQYLKRTTVRVIDNDKFPSNKYKNLDSPAAVEEVAKWPLMFSFFRLVANIPKVWRGSIQYMMVDVVHGLTYLFKLFMNVYMLDWIVNTHKHDESELLFTDNREYSLYIIIGIGVADVAIAHYLEYARLAFSVSGPTRNFLQNALLRKFLNYKRSTREHLSNGDVIAAVERDANDLVGAGYTNALKVFGVVFQLACMVTFKVASSGPPFKERSSGGSHNASMFILAVPGVLVCFLLCRERETSKALRNRNITLKDFTNQVSITTQKYPLVMDYGLRIHSEKLFLQKQNIYSKINRIASQILTNNEYFCNWCQFAVVSFWTYYGGKQVIEGNLSVGLFVTNLSLFKDLGGSLAKLYMLAVNMMNAFPALTNVTTLMNLPVDVRQRCRLTKLQQAQAKTRRANLRSEVKESNMNIVPIDLMPIVFNFPNKFKFDGKMETLNFYGTVQIHQGQMVAVVGPLGSGKATLLNLLVGTVLPQDGKGMPLPIFVPPHLRIVNVADQPLFFGGTLYDSLTFGMEENDPDADRERVRTICWRFTKSETIMNYLDDDSEESWQDLFSGAQCKLLTIARGLIHNPDVLCVHKPLATLTNDDQEHVVQALKEHIDDKGLEISLEPSRRRPRTVILSAASDRAIDESDNVIIVNPATGIRLLHPEATSPTPATMQRFGTQTIEGVDPNETPRTCGDCPAQ